MLIISVRDDEDNRWKRKAKGAKEQRGDTSYSESVRG